MLAPPCMAESSEILALAACQRSSRTNAGVVSATAQMNDFQPVTDEVLRNPSDADWLQWRRTYDGWAYSPLDQINRQNVRGLQLVWSRALNTGQVELIPLVYNGVMYIPHPGGVIEAVDATTGDLVWQ